ncbi:hypothetical protein [Bdellovibrio sp. HCB209]|uniref:hypothetical protein n=1 Tax=Bdellovibrio sp. HCB209 TaxID=3394354 RepID=UPI0039B61C98
MLPKQISSNRGFAGAMLVITIAVVVGIIIVGIVSKMGVLNKSYDKTRAFFDSEMAIEKFGTELKSAYDKANYLRDTPPTSGGTATNDDYGCPGKIVKIGAGAGQVRLCWESSSGVCSKRTLNAGADICIEASNLQVSILSPNEWMVAYEAPPKNTSEQWDIFLQATHEVIKELSFPVANANLEVFTPALPTAASLPTNSIPINTSVRNAPEAPTCDTAATNPFQCLKVSFCVRKGINCASTDLVRQTYLFTKPATTTQGYN